MINPAVFISREVSILRIYDYLYPKPANLQAMVRYETNTGVAYGSDPASGVFLSVELNDDRFELHTGRDLTQNM